MFLTRGIVAFTVVTSFCLPVLAHADGADSAAHPLVAAYERFHATAVEEAAQAQGGLLLLSELNCTACHAAPSAWQQRLQARSMISLAKVGQRLPKESMRQFLEQPTKYKPGTLMPHITLSPDELAVVTDYLSTLKDPQAKTYPQGVAETGRQLFHTIGCVACHTPETVEQYRPAEAPEGLPVEPLRQASIPLKLGAQYDVQALAAFLQDPLSVRHSGRMPSFEMSDQEAADLATYLKQRFGDAPDKESPKESVVTGQPLPHPGLVLAQHHCLACHEVGPTEPQPTPAAQPAALRALVELSPDAGCLSVKPPAQAPDFGLSPQQRTALNVALQQVKASPAPPKQTAAELVDHHFQQLNCYACHSRQGSGGLEPGRVPYFTVLVPMAHSLGEIGMLPPKLDSTGRKISRKWLEKLLWGHGGGVRDYMTIRMPRFGKENAADLIPELLVADQRTTPVEMDTSGLLKHHRAENGRVLLGTGQGGLGCVSCHGLKDRPSLGVPVIRLTHTAERLQPEFFKELLLNPQAVQPGTLMPPLFMGRKKADLEVEQLWTYFKEVDQSRLPEGLLKTGDYEVSPAKQKRPVVFRTFLEGAGMQAVAVGYPVGWNVAFDSLENRWAIAWKGRFLDAMTTWEERAMTPAKPLEEATNLPLRIALAPLGTTAETWPSAGGDFKGYRLDHSGVPTFHYHLDGLQVTERLTPTDDGKSLRRQIVLSSADSPEGSWLFWGLSPDAKPIPVKLKNGKATLEEALTLPVPPTAPAP